jgi:hypothetical protein
MLSKKKERHCGCLPCLGLVVIIERLHHQCAGAKCTLGWVIDSRDHSLLFAAEVVNGVGGAVSVLLLLLYHHQS